MKKANKSINAHIHILFEINTKLLVLVKLVLWSGKYLTQRLDFNARSAQSLRPDWEKGPCHTLKDRLPLDCALALGSTHFCLLSLVSHF